MFQIEKYHFDAASDFGNCIVIVSNRKIPFSYCILILEIALSLLQIANFHFYKAMWFWILYCSCFKYQNTIFVWKLYCYCFKYQNTIFMLYPDFGNCIVIASNIKIPFLCCILILEIMLYLLQISKYHFYTALWFWQMRYYSMCTKITSQCIVLCYKLST